MADPVATVANVERIFTYGTYENNNLSFRNQVVILVDTPLAGCEGGFWISGDDAENNPTMVSMLLSAFHANSQVRFSAYNDDFWSGSSTKYCRINNLALVR
jgi:hypothetical protein